MKYTLASHRLYVRKYAEETLLINDDCCTIYYKRDLCWLATSRVYMDTNRSIRLLSVFCKLHFREIGISLQPYSNIWQKAITAQHWRRLKSRSLTLPNMSMYRVTWKIVYVALKLAIWKFYVLAIKFSATNFIVVANDFLSEKNRTRFQIRPNLYTYST